jgi:integrase
MTEEKKDKVHKAKKEVKSRRRGQGEGSIYKLKDGRWAAAMTIGFRNGKLQRKYVYAKTRPEVAEKLNNEITNKNRGLPVSEDKQTVKQFLLNWLENSVKSRTRLSTYISYKLHVEQHITPEIGHLRLARLTPQEVQKMVQNLMAKKSQLKKKGAEAKPLSNRTVQLSLVILRMALKKAETWGLVARNVALLADAPKVERFEVQPIDADEARKLLEIFGNDDRWDALFTVGLAMGLRIGEALALKWSDIDFENRALRISSSLQRSNRKLVIVPVKTKKSARVLNIPKVLLDKLRDHRTRQLKERLAAGTNWQDSNFVFCTSIGTPIEPRNVRRKLDAIMKDKEIRYFRLHDLRHYFASLLLAQGVELKIVSELLGHSSIQITGDIYTHVIPKVKEQTMDIMNSILTGRK